MRQSAAARPELPAAPTHRIDSQITVPLILPSVQNARHLHGKVVPGAADRSYGIQVARLAGLPLSVINRAKTILAKLESDDTDVTLPTAAAPQAKPKKKITVVESDDSQLSLL